MPDSAEITVIVLGIVLYFLPSVIAFIRGHHNKLAIFVLNLFLAWSFLGWVGAMVWAFTKANPTQFAWDKIKKE